MCLRACVFARARECVCMSVHVCGIASNFRIPKCPLFLKAIISSTLLPILLSKSAPVTAKENSIYRCIANMNIDSCLSPLPLPPPISLTGEKQHRKTNNQLKSQQHQCSIELCLYLIRSHPRHRPCVYLAQSLSVHSWEGVWWKRKHSCKHIVTHTHSLTRTLYRVRRHSCAMCLLGRAFHYIIM